MAQWQVDALARAFGVTMPSSDPAPRRTQVQLGALADSVVAAVLCSVAGHMPEIIVGCLHETRHKTALSEFHEAIVKADGTGYEPTGRIRTIHHSLEVPVAVGGHVAIFIAQNDVGTAWASLLEKAFASLSDDDPSRPNGYAGLERLPLSEGAKMLTQLTGEPSVIVHLDRGEFTEGSAEELLAAKLRARKPVLTHTKDGGRGSPDLPSRLISGHAYEVVQAGNDRIQLWNPWNMRHPDPMGVQEFLAVTGGEVVTLE